MKYAFINGIILNGDENMEPVYGKTILVDEGKITDICDAAHDCTGYSIVDLDGKYIMPGLINMHVHLQSEKQTMTTLAGMLDDARRMNHDEVYKKEVIEYCIKNQVQVMLKSGVTTIRTVGGSSDTDIIIRDAIQRGEVFGPRMLSTTQALCAPGGHMEGIISRAVSTPEETRSTVRDIAAQNVNLIKLMITGGVFDATAEGEPGALKMPPELVKAACDEAHAIGLPVASHVEGTAGLKAALKGGVDTVDHGAAVDEETIHLYLESGAAQIATFSPLIPFVMFDSDFSKLPELGKHNGKLVLDGLINNAQKGLEYGFPVGLGTDAGTPFVTHYDTWRELVYFHKFCNVSNQFALYTATKRNAQIAGISDVTGTIDIGKSADMIVTYQNPLEDLTTLRRLKMVIMAGNILSDPEIDKNLTYEQELDKYL